MKFEEFTLKEGKASGHLTLGVALPRICGVVQDDFAKALDEGGLEDFHGRAHVFFREQFNEFESYLIDVGAVGRHCDYISTSLQSVEELRGEERRLLQLNDVALGHGDSYPERQLQF